MYKFQIKLTLSVVTDANLAFFFFFFFFNQPVARKDLKFKRTKWPFALLTDRCANRHKAFGQRYINITGNAIGPKSGQKDCRKF